MHLLNRLPIIFLFLPGLAAPAAAEWGWYAGDIATFSADNTSTTIPESVHNAVESGLDWVVLSADPGSGAFVGLEKIVDEVKLTMPRLTPILGSGWTQAKGSVRILGIDARAPIPTTLNDLLSTVSSHHGVVVQEAPGLDSVLDETIIFSPIRDGEWTSTVATGGPWDEALAQGRRVFIAGTSSGSRPAATHRTMVWAEDNQADQLIKSLGRGASYIAENGGIHFDIQVNGRTLGQTVFHQGEPFVRIKAHAEHPISSVMLIADGEEIWSSSPNKTIWEERFFLPAGDFSYIRPVFYSEAGGYRSLGNPVFLVSENPVEGELPLVKDRSVPSGELIEMSGMLEASTGLSENAQTRILREFLADATTRYGTCWLLQDRTDIVSDRVLADLALTDTSAQVQLGAAYALVVRGSDLSPDVLLAFLESSSAEIQSYAARIFAHYTEGFTEEDWAWGPTRDPESNAYLIRAYHPFHFSENQITSITEVLDSEHPALSRAANDKLVELGTRHYRVIETLLDSAKAGSASAAVVLGQIGDHRTIGALQRIFEETNDRHLKRSVFLALDRMGAPYPARQSLVLPDLLRPPTLDGVIAREEWEHARLLGNLKSDWDGEIPTTPPTQVRAGIQGDSAYIAVSQTLEDGFPVATLTDDARILGKEDELVEIVFAKPPYGRDDSANLLRIRINAMGILDLTRSVGCRASSRVTPNGWELEAAIPLETVQSLSRFNLSVISPSASVPRLAWSVTYGAPQDPSRFGDIGIEGASP
jgi:hypothetical protein